jgi:hypothetical protein
MTQREKGIVLNARDSINLHIINLSCITIKSISGENGRNDTNGGQVAYATVQDPRVETM